MRTRTAKRRLGLVLYAAVIMAVGVPTVATSESTPPDSDINEVRDLDGLADWVQSLTAGRDVIELGAPSGDGVTIDEVSRATGRSETELVELLADEAMWVDGDGMVLAMDPLHVVSENAPETVATVTDADERTSSATTPTSAQHPPLAQASLAAMSVDQVLGLHSRPGSQKVAYLDFTGHVVSATAWNAALSGGANMVVPAWDFDGSAAFGVHERAVMLEIWQRVAEDFAPFDIDVTTAEPTLDQLQRTSAADTTFGTRLLIAPFSQLNQACDCGGVSYVGTFNRTGDNTYYQPGLVFSDALGASNAKNLAEAASHEIGHSLGLGHVVGADNSYATGHAAWAPIMGSSYDRPLTQWLVDSNYGGKSYDDVAVMTRHGVDLLYDDHGNSPASATSLGRGPSVGAGGMINSGHDVDVFQFTTSGGRTVIGVEPNNPGANLDVRLDLLGSLGAVVASAGQATEIVSASQVSGLSAVLDVELVAGTYYLRVDGAGYSTVANGALNDHGSIGRYSLVATFPISGNSAPLAVATASANSWESGVSVQFDSSRSADSDGSVHAVWWDFGDGSTSSDRQVTKTFTNPGSYSVVLTVIDNVGAIGSTALLVTVGTDGGVITSIDLAGSTASILAAARAAISGTPMLAAAPLRESAQVPTVVDALALPAILPETL